MSGVHYVRSTLCQEYIISIAHYVLRFHYVKDTLRQDYIMSGVHYVGSTLCHLTMRDCSPAPHSSPWLMATSVVHVLHSSACHTYAPHDTLHACSWYSCNADENNPKSPANLVMVRSCCGFKHGVLGHKLCSVCGPRPRCRIDHTIRCMPAPGTPVTQTKTTHNYRRIL